MSNKEIYITLIINIIFAFRILGIFTVLPVLTTYGMQLIGANASLIGISIGIYGLTQILFQIPYGLASDYIGRKPIIIGGLLISIIGTTIAAISNNIWGVILGRTLQGSSAINGILIAVLFDQLKEKNKTKAMILIGLNFSIMFALSIILAPIITSIIGLQGLFLSITFLTLLGLILTILYIPSSQMYLTKYKSSIMNINKNKLIKLLTHPQLIKLNCSIFFLHSILMLNFTVVPKIMNTLELLPMQQSRIYCINILISLLISIIGILYAEKKRKMKILLIVSICILFFSEIMLLCASNNTQGIFLGILLFFIAFNLIEGILPSLLSKETPITHKGITTGIFSTSQYSGVTFGGIFGGYLLDLYNIQTIFFSIILLITIWFIITLSLKEPLYKN